MMDRVGKMATVLIRAMTKAAQPRLLPSCDVVVVVGVLSVVVVFGGVPDPEERTSCILLPLVSLLLAPTVLTGVFTGGIAPVVRIIPVVLEIVGGIFK